MLLNTIETKTLVTRIWQNPVEINLHFLKLVVLFNFSKVISKQNFLKTGYKFFFDIGDFLGRSMFMQMLGRQKTSIKELQSKGYISFLMLT